MVIAVLYWLLIIDAISAPKLQPVREVTLTTLLFDSLFEHYSLLSALNPVFYLRILPPPVFFYFYFSLGIFLMNTAWSRRKGNRINIGFLRFPRVIFLFIFPFVFGFLWDEDWISICGCRRRPDCRVTARVFRGMMWNRNKETIFDVFDEANLVFYSHPLLFCLIKKMSWWGD